MGYTNTVIQRLDKARVQSTNTTYNSRWKLFSEFCTERDTDPFLATPATVAEFLTYVADSRGATTSTLAGFRSAIGAVLRLSTGYNPGECPILAQLMKSFRRTQPLSAKRIPQWDISLVLSALCESPLADDQLPLQIHTAKAVFLVALASGDRCHALAALTNPVQSLTDKCIMTFDESYVPKSYFLKRNQSRIAPLVIPRVSSDTLRKVCPCTTVEGYQARVAGLRSPLQTSLFIPHNLSKMHNMSSQAVARYIKTLVAWCYDQKQQTLPGCRAHDVRKVATALRELSSTSLTDLLGAGQWTTPLPFLNHYKLLGATRPSQNLKYFEGLPVANSTLLLQDNE